MHAGTKLCLAYVILRIYFIAFLKCIANKKYIMHIKYNYYMFVTILVFDISKNKLLLHSKLDLMIPLF